MSILVTSVAVAGGLAFGRWLSQRAALTESRRAELKSRVAAANSGSSAVEAPNAHEILWTRFPCRLGDVIVHPSGDEAWLAGAIILSEDVAAAVLFVAPEAKNDRAVYARAKPVTEIFWLSPLAADGWTPPDTDPPTTIEIEGEPFERIRRLPYRTEAMGEGTPSLGAEILLAEYKSLRSLERRVISISGKGSARAWIGSAIDIRVCDVLPAGARAAEKSEASDP